MAGVERCPECGEESLRTHTWEDGAKTEDCASCGYWDWEPPAPTVGDERLQAGGS